MSNEFPPKQDRPAMTGPLNDIEAEAATLAAADEAFEEAGGNEPEVARLHEDAAGEVEGEATGDTVEPVSEPSPPAKLERLQKILAQAGVASRRHAEELITQGRVQVNGKVVTELGTKADADHDHIRVDGKLLKGSERLRYFVLNKPKGFVTTVTDPEGRPTVMQFFEKMRERLYPVGRLDYASEGLLLVTNDGDLANRLTKAGSRVEKTYLVKVSGQPTEDALESLRTGGIAIDRNRPGSDKVRTAPARIRLVRAADNPWYEVVLIEGRNRELRKMFEEIGHHVEKIRRVGYGPLVLDQEPGNLRELDAGEVEALQKAAEGKWKTPKAEEVRRRHALDDQMQTLAPRTQRQRPFRPTRESGGERRGPGRSGEFRPKQRFGGEGFKERAGEREKGRQGGNFGRGPAFGDRQRTGSSREFGRREQAGTRREGAGRNRGFQARPDWKDRGTREEFQRPQGGRRDRGRQGSRDEELRRSEFARPQTEEGDFGRPRRFERGDTNRPGGPRFDRQGRSSGRFEPRRQGEGARDVGGRSRGPAERRSPGGKDWGTRPKFKERGRDEERGSTGSRSEREAGPNARSAKPGFRKSGFKSNAGAPGARRSGPRPPGSQGGKRRGGPPGERKRK